MSKYLAFFAALPLAVMPMTLAFMIISAVHEPSAVAEHEETSAIVRQETTATAVPVGDTALNRVHEIQFNTDRPKQLRKGPNTGRRDADRRRRIHRKNLEDPSERKRIVVPPGINDTYAGQYEIKPGSMLTISRRRSSDVGDYAERQPAVIWS